MHTDQPLDVTLIQPSTPPDTHTSHPLNSFCISTSHSHISADAEVHSLPGSDTSSFFRGGLWGDGRGAGSDGGGGDGGGGGGGLPFFFLKVWVFDSVPHSLKLKNSPISNSFHMDALWCGNCLSSPHSVVLFFCYRRFIFMCRVILFLLHYTMAVEAVEQEEREAGANLSR